MILTKNEILSYLSNPQPLVEGFIDVDLQVQPNGFDLSLASIAKFQGSGRIDFSNTERILPDLDPIDFDPDGWVKLMPGCYVVTFNEAVNLPLDIMAMGKPRSSVLRMGATLETAVWDAGYSGRSQSLLIIFNPDGVEILKNARIMQLVFMRLSTETKGYEGIYQGENV